MLANLFKNRIFQETIVISYTKKKHVSHKKLLAIEVICTLQQKFKTMLESFLMETETLQSYLLFFYLQLTPTYYFNYVASMIFAITCCKQQLFVFPPRDTGNTEKRD